MSKVYLEIQGKSMSADQREFLKHLAEMTQERFEYPIIVNIGVLLGCSLACLRAGSPDGIIIGVDRDLKRRFPRPEYLAYLRTVFIECHSHEFAKMFRSPVHLVFVDGGHAYQTALGDMQLWSTKIPKGGIIAIHDLHMGQVQKAFSEWYDPKLWEKVGGAPCFRAYERVTENKLS